MQTMIRFMILAAVILAASPATAGAKCQFKFQCSRTSTSTPSRTYIVNQHRQKVGDIYSPGSGRRIQIRDTSRRIIGYIGRDGTVTNTHRQRIGTVELSD